MNSRLNELPPLRNDGPPGSQPVVDQSIHAGGIASKAILTPDDVAALLNTTRRAVYARVSRGQLPGAFRIGRSLYFRGPALLPFLIEGRAPSLKRGQR